MTYFFIFLYDFFGIIGCISQRAFCFVSVLATKEVHGICLYFVEIVWKLIICCKVNFYMFLKLIVCRSVML